MYSFRNDGEIIVIQRVSTIEEKRNDRNFPLCEVMRQFLYDFRIFFFLFLFFPSIIFASPCILKKEVVSHDGTCRAIWEINDVTLIRSRLTKQGTRSNVIDAYECIQEHCTPSPLGEHFNHTLWSATMTSMLLHTERERGRERVKMRTDGMERNASWERGGEKKNYSVR